MPRKSTNHRARPNGRRKFLAVLATAPLVWALESMLARQRNRSTPDPIPLPADIPTGLSVVGDAIVHREADGSVRAFSARCTHLGCRLDRIVDGNIVCPCHGSRFKADGSVATGPAVRPLTPLKVSTDAETGGWIVRAG